MRDWTDRGHVKAYKPRRRQGKCWHCMAIGAKGCVVHVKWDDDKRPRYKWVCEVCLRKKRYV